MSLKTETTIPTNDEEAKEWLREFEIDVIDIKIHIGNLKMQKLLENQNEQDNAN